MKTLILMLFATAAVAQTAPAIIVGSDAPPTGICNVVAVGTIYVRSENPANGPINVSRCTQTGSLSYAWQPIDHIIVASLPAACAVGDIAFLTGVTAGQNVYGCTAANTWTLQSGSATGTVTVVGSGSLTSTAISTGGGTTTIQTPSATATLDSGGNMSLPGTLTIGTTVLNPTTGIKGPTIACAGAPGNTTGPYQSLCIVPATAALWGCTNAAGCTVSADWTSAGGGGGSGTVTSVGLAGTANQITVTGATPITGSGSWTLSLPSTLVLPSGSTATTQSLGDGSTKVATTSYVDSTFASNCTLAKYTLTISGGNIVLSGAGSSTTALAAATTQNITLLTLASTAVRICSMEISGTTSYTGGTATAAVLAVGSGATAGFYSPYQDIFGTVGPSTNNYWSDRPNTADRTNLVVAANFVTTGGNMSGITAGVVDIVIGTYTRP